MRTGVPPHQELEHTASFNHQHRHPAYLFKVRLHARTQVRHHIKDWDAEVSHEFGQAGAVVGLAKHFKFATLRGSWDTGAKEAALQYKRK